MDNTQANRYLSANTFGIFSIFIKKQMDFLSETNKQTSEDLASFKKEVVNTISPIKGILNNVALSMNGIANYFDDYLSALKAKEYALEEQRTESATTIMDVNNKPVAVKEVSDKSMNLTSTIGSLLTNPVVIAALAGALYSILPDDKKQELKDAIKGFSEGFLDEIDLTEWTKEAKLIAGTLGVLGAAGTISLIASSVKNLLTVITAFKGTKGLLNILKSPAALPLAAGAAAAATLYAVNKMTGGGSGALVVEDYGEGAEGTGPKAGVYKGGDREAIDSTQSKLTAKTRSLRARKETSLSKRDLKDGTKFKLQTDAMKPFKGSPGGMVIHHTGGDTTEGAVQTLKERKLSYNYLIEKDGSIVRLLPEGISGQHIASAKVTKKLPDGRKMMNNNTIGVAAVASSNESITPQQIEAAVALNKQLASKYGYSPTAVYGHGQVQSSKSPTEGMVIVDAIKSNVESARPVISDTPKTTTGTAVGTLSHETGPAARATKYSGGTASGYVQNQSTNNNVTKGMVAPERVTTIPSPAATRPSLGLKAKYN